jgi:hypothetical protein
MKRKYVWIITIIIIVTISILTYGYLNAGYQKIDIYIAKDFNKKISTPIESINDKNTLIEISTILEHSSKMLGILDVASPDYILEIYSFNKNMETVYLWVREDSALGMYMYKNNTETGYSISETNTEKLKNIVITTKK